MKKKISIIVISSLLLAFGASGCSGKAGGKGATPTPWIVTATPTPRAATSTPTATCTPLPTLSPTPEPDLFNGDPYFEASTALEKKLGKYYNRVFTNGLLSTGNSFRLREKLTKSSNGEDIVICYLGGSVTEGEGSTERTPQGYKKGYAYMSYEYIRDKYGKGDNVKYVNAAISGTGSDLGMVRADEDVLSYAPDIIFVEFAVNNDNSAYNKMTYEGLIRKFLKAENEPAVILLFSAATYAGQTQTYMKPMGTYYDLPMVSMKTALDVPQNLKVIEWKDFSNDTVHPKTDGHKLYAKLIAYMIDKAAEDTSATEYVVKEKPSVTGFDFYEETIMIDNSNAEGLITETGSFKAGTTRFSSSGNSDNHALMNGWSRAAGDGNDGLKIDLTCSSFSVVVKQTNSQKETSLDVYVDGKLRKTILTSKSGAWNNPVTTLIFVEDESKRHEILIKPSAGSEGSGQTVLAFAYTK